MRKGRLSAAALLLLLAWSCGGGGGGGGDGRTTDTGVRLLHGSIDGSPLTVTVGEFLVQKASFIQSTEFVRVDEGQAVIVVERVNSPGVVLRTIPITLEDKTEYSLFVTGQARDGSETVRVLAEPVERPESGEGRIQFLNSVFDAGSLTLSGAGFSSGAVAEGRTSGFVLAVSGPQTLQVRNSSGTLLATVNFELSDRGEASILAAGSSELGVVFTQVYLDLD